MCQKTRPFCFATNTVIKININPSEFPRNSLRNEQHHELARVSDLARFWNRRCRAVPLNAGESGKSGGRSDVMLLPFPLQLAWKSFHIPHYHNWVCFCSPLSIADIYCNKLKLVSAASLDLPEFVISGERLICCNLIRAIPSLAVELGGPGEIGPSGSL